MRIALFVNSAKTFFWHRKALADLLIQEGHEVHIICSTADDTTRFKESSYNVHFVCMSRKGKNPFSELKVIFDLYKIFKTLKPDLSHNFTIKCVIYGSLVQKFIGCPIIVNSITGLGIVFTKENFLQRVVKFFYWSVFRLTGSKIIFQNPDDLKLFIDSKIISKNNPNKLILGSGVNTEKFVPGIEKSKVIRIVFASRLLKSKGVLKLIDSSILLLREGVNHELLIAGETDPMSPDSITKEDLDPYRKFEHISFLGNVEDMPSLLSTCHIACFPSYYREGVPKFLIESASAGLAIITTNAPGCREVVEGNGIKVPPFDDKALLDALRLAVLDHGLLESWGSNSRTLAIKKFSEKQILREILDFYHS